MPTPGQDTPPPTAPPTGGAGRGPFAFLLRLRPGEGWAVLTSAAYFFFVLLSYYMLRPVREAMGITRGYDALPWLMTGTLLVMAGINPVYAWFVSRVPRRVFIPLTYRFFAVNMLVFLVLFQVLPETAHVGLGYAFYIWLSVFNLFVVSVFWGLTADVYSREQGTRLFGMIAVGGTIGAMSGAKITEWCVQGIGLAPATMLAVTILPLEAAVQCVKRLLRWQADSPARSGVEHSGPASEPTSDMWSGLRAIVRSPFLLAIALYMLLYTTTSTFLYMEQGRIVSQTFDSAADRTAAFARMDFWTNALTLFTQLFLTGRVMRVIGVGGTLCVLPIITFGGFAALMIDPSFAVLAVFQVLRRGLHYAVDRPAREVLYTSLGQDERYKSKSFIDTFVYRTGDMIGGWTPKWLGAAGIAVGWVALPISAIWLAVGAGLGVMQSRTAARKNRADGPR
ncbi:MAG: hypothetical protein KF787_01695 [Phycisphaeraceae bacterium]|nr:MFS transporter [Phycisphaerae bacterium]MBX3391336.1 hypothetical protein [Phycisphaeraceae bacterium]